MARSRSPRKTASPAPKPAAKTSAKTAGGKKPAKGKKAAKPTGPQIVVRHMTRRDIGDVWDFLKVSFRDVNAETVEYQRPRSRRRFEEIFEEEGIEQLLLLVDLLPLQQ